MQLATFSALPGPPIADRAETKLSSALESCPVSAILAAHSDELAQFRHANLQKKLIRRVPYDDLHRTSSVDFFCASRNCAERLDKSSKLACVQSDAVIRGANVDSTHSQISCRNRVNFVRHPALTGRIPPLDLTFPHLLVRYHQWLALLMVVPC